MLATVRRDNIEARGQDSGREVEEAEFKQPIKDAFDEQSDPYFATARLWDDGIIAPSETRRVLALAYSAALNAPVEETKFGVFQDVRILRNARPAYSHLLRSKPVSRPNIALFTRLTLQVLSRISASALT